MFFLKILLTAAGFAAAGYYGRAALKRYGARSAYFSEITLFCNYLTNEINFAHSPLAEIAEKYAGIFKSPLSAQLKSFRVILGGGGATDTDALGAALPRGVLKSGEYDTVIQFFAALGKSDSESQARVIGAFGENFAARKGEADAYMKKYGALYPKLALLAACAAGILIL